MSRLFFLGFALGLKNAFRTLVPHPQDRIPITWRTWPYLPISFLPFLFMAYLVRRPDTHLIRILLLPSVLCANLGAVSRFVWTSPEVNVYNWGQCLVATVMVANALDFAFTKEGRRKIGEIRPGDPPSVTVQNKNLDHLSSRAPLLPRWLYDGLELALSPRGLGWDFGKGVHIPAHTRPQERNLFLRATLSSFVLHFLLLDFLETILKLFPGVGRPTGGTMFYPNLPPLQRYAVSTTIHMLTGCAFLSGFNMVYDLVTLLSVLLLDSPPSAWPPAMDNPWSSDSLHVFWSKRWHQFLRRTFMVYGGYPGEWLFGKFGKVQGVFLASGLYHECPIYIMGRGWDHRVITFFMMQASLFTGERLWKKFTGRKVGGWVGRVWVYFNLCILAQPMMDAWHMRGLGGAMVIPPIISPTRQFWVPLLQTMLDRQLRG